MMGWLAKKAGKKMLGKAAGSAVSGAVGGVVGGVVGGAVGAASVAMKWPFLIAVAVWNILDAVLALFIKSPLWVFLILILLDALVNIILIIMVINGKSIFKLWIWDLILFGWAALSTLLNIIAGWWFFDWIIDPLLMVICCFLVSLMPFDMAGGGKPKQQWDGEDAPGYSETASNRRTAARRGGESVEGSPPDSSQNGATIINIGSVSSDPLRKDYKE